MIVLRSNANQVSSVALANIDEATGLMDVVVEPGEGRLYIIVSSEDPTIWRFSGSNDRVSQVVLLGEDGWQNYGRVTRRARGPDQVSPVIASEVQAARLRGERLIEIDHSAPQGTIGVDPARVMTIDAHLCGGGQTRFMISAVFSAFDRRPVLALDTARAYAGILVPSGRGAQGAADQPVPEGFDPTLWQYGLGRTEGGVAFIAASDVNSPAGAIEYEILPEWFGLAQLFGSGHIESENPGLRMYDFRILRPLPRLPSGLMGIRFYQDPSLPIPLGDLDRNCIYLDGSGSVGSSAELCASLVYAHYAGARN